MTSRFYQPGSERATKVDELFGAIARRYDLMNDLQSFGLHRAWKRRVVELAKPRPGERALDLCCGTGDIAFALAKKGVRVVGLDFNQPMLAVAQQRSQGFGFEDSLKPQFIRADAQQIPFPPNSFEIVTIGYGLRNLAEWKTGLREMQRVAVPGGRLLVLEFGKPDNALWRRIYFGYMKLFVPLLGLAVCGNAAAYSYILESLKHFPGQHGVADSMRELGLVNVRTLNPLGGVMGINYAEKTP